MNFHKAFLLYIVLFPILNKYIPITNISGLPQQQMTTIITFYFVMFFCLYAVSIFKLKILYVEDFPLKKAFFLYMLSLVISALFQNITPLVSTTISTFLYILNTYIFVYLFYKEVRSEKDIKFIINGFAILFSLAILYGFYEKFNDFDNPIMAYEFSISPLDKDLQYDDSYVNSTRGNRVRSIFPHPLECGAYMALIFTFYYFLFTRFRSYWSFPWGAKVIFLVGTVFILVFANGRGAVLYALIAFAFLQNIKTMLKLMLWLPLVALVAMDIITMLIYSTFNAEAATDAGGSNLAMRLMQLNIVFQIFIDKPLLGYGINAYSYWHDRYPEILGAESVWLGLMLRQGVFGIIAYCYLLHSIIKIKTIKSNRFIIGSTLAWLIMETTTVGGNIIFFLIIILLVQKMDLLNNAKYCEATK
jgi:O-antigen ligase